MFCMGVWLGGSVFITVVATQNFFTIDRLLEQPGDGAFNALVTTMKSPTARELMRYVSSELNRLYFQYWNILQLVVGIVALRLVSPLPGSKHATWGIAAMLFAVLFLMVFITPPLIRIGRELDFMPRDPAPPQMRTFGLLHATYSAFTIVNVVLGVLVTLWIQKEQPSQDS